MDSDQINHAIECCKKGNTLQLKECLKYLTDKSIADSRGRSLLCLALKNSHWEIAKYLVQENFVSSCQDKPLMVAASQCLLDETQGIELLLDQSVNINATDNRGRTALMTSCLLGHINKVELLLSNGSLVNIQDDEGNNALIDAVHSNKSEVVKCVLNSSPAVNQENKEGAHALLIAVSQKSPSEEIVNQLLNYGFDPELQDQNKNSAWLIASRKHKKIQKLISQHLNVVKQIELPFFTNDYQVEQTSEKAESEKTVKITAENTEAKVTETKDEIRLKTKDVMNSTTHEKVYKPSKPLYKTEKQNLSSKEEWFMAAKSGNLGQLNRQIVQGIDIDCKDSKGCTALIRASGNKRRAVVSYLLQQNAEIEARSKNGSTALSSSIIGNCRRVAGLLLEKGANPNGLGPSDYRYVTIATAQWNEAMLSILYRYRAEIHIINDLGQNLAHVAAMAAEYYQDVSKAKATFSFLADHGVNLNLQDNEGNTPLMILTGVHKARYKVHDRNLASLIHHLLKIGSSVVPTNHQGISALDGTRKHKLFQCKGVLMNALSWAD